MAHNWIRMTPDSLIPSNAVIGEIDSDGSPTYVGRSFHEGGTFPARVDPKKHCAYVSWAGSQIKKTDYDVLVGENYRFVKCSAVGIPISAIRAGNTANGDPLWVGRGILDGNKKIVGKIHPIHRCLLVAFGGEEHRLDSYEVLVHDATYEEDEASIPESLTSDVIPPETLIPDVKNDVCVGELPELDGEEDEDLIADAPQLPAPENLTLDIVPPKEDIPDVKNGISVGESPEPTDEKENVAIIDTLQLPVPESQSLDIAPPKAVVPDVKNDVSGGKPSPSESHTWVRSSWGKAPPNAVVAGNDSDGSTIYVGRAYHEGENLPAKVIPRKSLCYVSYDGSDVFKIEFEVLVGDGYKWVEGSHSGDNIPNGAVSTGQTRNGKPVYVGRGPHIGSITPGKVLPGEYCVYIPFYQKEHKITDYEILVKTE